MQQPRSGSDSPHSPVVGLASAEALFARDPVAFVDWVITEVGGHAFENPAYRGIDGILPGPRDITGQQAYLLIAVKCGAPTALQAVTALAGAVDELNAAGAVLVTMTPPSPAVRDAARPHTGTRRSPQPAPWAKVEFLTVEEILDGKHPRRLGRLGRLGGLGGSGSDYDYILDAPDRPSIFCGTETTYQRYRARRVHCIARVIARRRLGLVWTEPQADGSIIMFRQDSDGLVIPSADDLKEAEASYAAAEERGELPW